MDFPATAACTVSLLGPGSSSGSRSGSGSGPRSGSGSASARRRLSLLAALLLGACATAAPPIDQPGPVLDANHAVSCPRGTVFAAGQTQGRLSAVWCERPDGRRHGPYVEWWENHEKKSAGLYQDGVRHGTWTFFLPSGQRDAQSEYRNGVAVTTP